MKIPVMPSISGHYGHIIIVNCNYIKVLGIKALRIFRIKQLQSPINTRLSAPVYMTSAAFDLSWYPPT